MNKIKMILTFAVVLFYIIMSAEVTQACIYGISSPYSPPLSPFGGGYGISVGAPNSCSWTAVNNDDWIHITSGSRTGSSSVSYYVDANPATSSRTGIIIITGRTHTVTQTGRTCTYSISSYNRNIGADGGGYGISVVAPDGCGWTAVSNDDWTHITSGNSGDGSSSVSYSVDANPTTSSRTGTISIAGKTHTVTQTGYTCTYPISSDNWNIGANGGNNSVSIITKDDCSWTAVSNDDWIKITSNDSGDGYSDVSYYVDANPTTSSRTGTISIAGKTHTVTQNGRTCTYSISSDNWNIGVNGGNNSVSIITKDGCSWKAVSNDDWIKITSEDIINGYGGVSYYVDVNPTTSSRTGTITIARKTHTVTQNGRTCTYSISSDNWDIGANGGNNGVSIIAKDGCSWKAVSNDNDDWIHITSGNSGNGYSDVYYYVDANPTASSRTGTITITGKTHNVTHTVTQTEGTCTYLISSDNWDIGADGGNNSVSITAIDGCNWTAVSNNDWIKIMSDKSGNGSGIVRFSTEKNPNTSSRIGTMNIARETFFVEQDPSSQKNPPDSLLDLLNGWIIFINNYLDKGLLFLSNIF